MAIDPNATRAAQAGKTVTTSDGYQITYDDNGFGRKSVGPDGEVKYFDSLGNQTKTEWNGPTPRTETLVASADNQLPTVILPSGETATRIEITGTNNAGTAEISPDSSQVNREPVPIQESLGAKEELVQPEKTISPDDDPFEKARQDAIAREDDSPTEQAVIDAESDPFEQARLQAIQDEQTSPTEQAVIDAKQDTKLSQEEEGQLREFQETQRALLKEQSDKAGNPEGNWTAGSVDQVRASQTVIVQRNTIDRKDWRVRLSLAPSAKYLYNIAAPTDILYPLKATDGVIFPYTPVIQTSYKASYDNLELQHSNYKMYFYKNSSVEEIQLTADFTAQDTTEANYLLAVMHFFKSVTKMFYGQDGNNGPKAGTPPPVVYLNGYGTYQFNEHPCLVQSFSYTLPNDVDYIRAGSITRPAGSASDAYSTKNTGGGKGFNLMSLIRKAASNLKTQGKISQEPNWTNYANTEATYLPTKIQLQFTLLPIVTRNDISKNFSVELYGTGQLTRGNKRPSGGGIW